MRKPRVAREGIDAAHLFCPKPISSSISLAAERRLPRTALWRSSSCLIAPVRRACPIRGQNTAEREYQRLMYAGPRTSDTLHKKPCRVGSGAGNRNTGKAGLPFLGGDEVASRPYR